MKRKQVLNKYLGHLILNQRTYLAYFFAYSKTGEVTKLDLTSESIMNWALKSINNFENDGNNF